jgi:multidrug efflux pump subunit AcrA (membrane-fusion protein)
VVLTTTSTLQLVQVKVKPEQQQLAWVGESAPVSLPGGQADQGRVIEVGSVASESEKGGGGGGGGGEKGGEGESATITVTLALERPVAHLDQAPVSVELVKSVRHDVLTVPATALTATGGGGYAIQVLENGRRVEVPVTPGMFANGFVQVEGAGLHEGQTVVESG